MSPQSSARLQWLQNYVPESRLHSSSGPTCCIHPSCISFVFSLVCVPQPLSQKHANVTCKGTVKLVKPRIAVAVFLERKLYLM